MSADLDERLVGEAEVVGVPDVMASQPGSTGPWERLTEHHCPEVASSHLLVGSVERWLVDQGIPAQVLHRQGAAEFQWKTAAATVHFTLRSLGGWHGQVMHSASGAFPFDRTERIRSVKQLQGTLAELVRITARVDRQEREAADAGRFRVLRMEWFAPTRLLERAPYRAFDHLIRAFPQCEPMNIDSTAARTLREAWQIARARDPWASVTWKGRPPCLTGSATLLGRLGYRQRGRACSRLSVTWKSTSLSSTAAADAMVKAFAAVCGRLGGFFGGAWQEHGYFEHGGRLYSDPHPDHHLLGGPGWKGLPEFPVWLAWFGRVYMPWVAESLGQSAVPDSGGLLVRHGDTPLDPDDPTGILPVRDRLKQRPAASAAAAPGAAIHAPPGAAELLPQV